MATMEVRNLKEFRTELRALGKQWPREVTKVHKKIGEQAAITARAEAMAGSKMQRSAARAIKGYGTQRSASVGVAKNPPYAAAAFWGNNKRTGWYAQPKYGGSQKRQFPKWVGNSWEPATYGQGPYAINSALARAVPHLLEDYETAIQTVARRAFPN